VAGGGGGAATAVAVTLDAARLKQGVWGGDAGQAMQNHVNHGGDKHDQREDEKHGVASIVAGWDKQQAAETAPSKASSDCSIQ